MPCSIMNRLASAARRLLSARLYSSEPHSSAWPSIRRVMPGDDRRISTLARISNSAQGPLRDGHGVREPRLTDCHLALALHQSPKPSVATQRSEVGVDAEPPRREIVGNLQQRLQLVQRLLGLAHHQVDPGELMLAIRPIQGVLLDRIQR
jgi:hypothetical protein